LMLGDAEAARELRRAAGALAGASPHPGLRWHLATYDAGLALLEGRLEEGEQIAREAFGAGERARHPYARGCYDIQRVVVALERGDPTVAVDVFGPFATRERVGWGVPIHWLAATVARAHLAAGERGEAEALWRRLAAPGFAAVPRNIRWTRSIAEIAHLCADLGASDHAPELVALIEPMADQHAVVPIPVAYGGPLRHALARLYDLLGRRASAEESHALALESVRRLGAGVWLPHVLLDSARAMRDPKRARRALEEALEAATRQGQGALAQEAEAALAAVASRAAHTKR
jgi:hypothetical protein